MDGGPAVIEIQLNAEMTGIGIKLWNFVVLTNNRNFDEFAHVVF